MEKSPASADDAAPRSESAGSGRAHPPLAGSAALLLVGLVVGLLALPGAASAQERLFPDESLMPGLDAAPLAPISRGAFVLADRPDSDFAGRNIEAEVNLGHALPVLLMQPEGERRPALGLEFRVAVFSRFFMETASRDLIAADYRVDIPFTFRYREWEGRIGYQHYSAHLADDFVRRFDPPLSQHSRDGFEAVVARRLPAADLRLYVGGRYAFHANPGVAESAAKAGAEWDPGDSRDVSSGVWPFLAADVEVRDDTDGVAGTAVGGLRIRVRGQDVRLEARGHAGPTSMGQLEGTDETFVGLGLRIDF